eukprot:GHVT01040192.1.p2 GENE.GHVT01040192.1~~GHVT01040192.1.p2  ORF type:complete len:102 (+),score=7.41 GHVT01040192.1:182-487(+)
MATACTVIGSEADPATSFAATNASTQDVFQANVRFDTNQKKSGRKSKSKQNEKLEVTKSSKSKKPKICKNKMHQTNYRACGAKHDILVLATAVGKVSLFTK